MRLSWFTGSRIGRRRQRRPKSAPLRVRQLERRRVLDAAIQSLAVSAVTTTIGQNAPAATSTATDSPPVNNPSSNNATDTAHSAAIAQGAILNVPPVLVAAADQEVNEGQLLDLSATGGSPPLGLYVDPDFADTHTATVNWGDSSPTENATIFAGAGAGALGGTHVYADDGTYTVTVNVMDNNGGTDTDTFDVLVKNVPPVLVTATDQMVNEGQLLDLSGTNGAPPLGLFVDPGLLDAHTATVNWGDGNPTQSATVFQGMGAGALGGTHTYADNGVYTVTVSVMDDDGGSDTATFDVTVKNVPPVLVTATDQMVNEGQLLDLSGMGGAPPLGLFVDPGLLDTHTATVNWGDGNPTQSATVFQGIGAGALGGTHTYADNGVYTVTVSVMDDDGGTDTESFEVTVKDVTPVVVLDPLADLNENGFVTLTGTYTDPGIQDTQTLTVHWDDPNNSSPSTFAIAAIQNAAGMATLGVGDMFNSSTDGAVLTITSVNASTGQVGYSVQHQYLDDGLAPGNGTISDTSTIMVSVADDDGQTGAARRPSRSTM